MFDLSAQFDRLATKDVTQSELDRFFTREFLTKKKTYCVFRKSTKVTMKTLFGI